MSSQWSLEQIRQFWTEQAVTHGQSPAASWSDTQVIDMEIRAILPHLKDGDRVLDVGCANGYSTVHFAAERTLTIRGLDYIEAMIDEARRRAADLASTLRGTVTFDVGNCLDLHEPDDEYDAVVVIRVIINLGAWSNQVAALLECGRVVRPGGHLLLSEATVEGWQKLNRFREEWDLPHIPMPPFNNYLDEGRVVEALSGSFDLVEIANFASSYFVGTRVLKPLLARALSSGVDVADPNMEWNRWFAQLPPWGDYGTQKLFVFRKRDLP